MLERLPAAVPWPLEAILATRNPQEVPAEFRGKKLLLICNAGISSAQAAIHLRQIGVTHALSVRGGAQEWIAASTAPGCAMSTLMHGSAETDAAVPAFRVSPVYEQWAVVIAFFGVKFVYSAIAAGIIFVLRKRREPDLWGLRWAMIFFFVGEAFCFVNVMVFFEHSALLEHLHSAGMVLSLGFSVWALLEGVDRRVIHCEGDGHCAAVALCGRCIKQSPVPCGLRRLFLMAVPAIAVLAAIPLCSDFRDTAYNTRILGVLHSYRHPIIHQVYEIRYLPLVAIVLLMACGLTLLLTDRRQFAVSRVLFAAAAGALGFSLLRLTLVAAFVDDQVWFAFWEETTELIYIGLVAAVLLVFSRGLLRPQAELT